MSQNILVRWELSVYIREFVVRHAQRWSWDTIYGGPWCNKCFVWSWFKPDGNYGRFDHCTDPTVMGYISRGQFKCSGMPWTLVFVSKQVLERYGIFFSLTFVAARPNNVATLAWAVKNYGPLASCWSSHHFTTATYDIFHKWDRGWPNYTSADPHSYRDDLNYAASNSGGIIEEIINWEPSSWYCFIAYATHL